MLMNLTDFIRSIRRVVEYIPILWHNYDFDHCYLYALMIYKLKRMEKNMRENDIHTSAQAKAKQMRIAIEYLKRVHDGSSYQEAAYSNLISKWWDSRTEDEQDNGCIRMKWDETSDEYKKLSKTIDRIKTKRDILDKENMNQFCKIFSKHSKSWWD